MELSPRPLLEGQSSVIPGGCKSPLPSGEAYGEGAKEEACHDLNARPNSETVSSSLPSFDESFLSDSVAVRSDLGRGLANARALGRKSDATSQCKALPRPSLPLFFPWSKPALAEEKSPPPGHSRTRMTWRPKLSTGFHEYGYVSQGH